VASPENAEGRRSSVTGATRKGRAKRGIHAHRTGHQSARASVNVNSRLFSAESPTVSIV